MTMRRGCWAVLAAAVLLAAACGDDDEGDAVATGTSTTAAERTTTSEAGSGDDEQVTGPADITADDQSGDGTTIEVASVTLPTPGFIAIHSDDGGAPGPVIGHSELLPEGESTDVVVTLDEPLTATADVHPMAHVDANDNGEYDFDPPAVTDDVPATFADGETAMVPITYTVDGSAAGDGDAAAGGSEVTVEDFTFQPATIEVSAGSTVTWTNEDSAPHTVTAGTPDDQGDEFHESLDAGGTAEITFDEAGTFAYHCSVHPGMRGEVVVS